MKNLAEIRIPSLALLPDNNLRLRYRLMELGVSDYLVVPFDKLDIQTRMKNLLLQDRNQLTDEKEKRGFRPSLPDLQQVKSVITEANRSVAQLNLEKLRDEILQLFYSWLQVDHLLFFEILNDDIILLKNTFPAFTKGLSLEIPINKLPSIIKAVRLKEVTILNQLQSGNPLYTYLKSYLNLEVKAFALYPVVTDNNTQALVLALQTGKQTFQKNHHNLLELLVSGLGITLYMSAARGQLQSELDGHLWKYSFEFLEHVINQLNFGILVIDKKRKVRYLNKPASELLQVDDEKILYRSLEELIGKTNAETVISITQRTEGAYERPEIEITTPDDTKVLIGFNIMEFKDSTDEDGGYIISLKDITYSKVLQEEMRRMDRLASLGVMASGIAHEIRNPLAGIKAIAQTFEEELSEDDPKNEFVKRIIRQVNRLDDMLRNLFSYAKPQKPNRQFHHIEGILHDVLSLLKQKIQQHNVKLNQSLAANLSPLFIDNSQIQQVLFNLVLNSLEAIEGEGEISISISEVNGEDGRLERKPFYRKISENPFVHIHISDTGNGIRREDLQQIFNPFFTTKPFGTGLGLSIVYQIVQENNGIIYFESEPGKGTECYLFLPAFEPKED